MQCRDFEDSMSSYFKEVDAELYRDAMVKNDWSGIVGTDAQHKALIQHVSSCDACQNSLWWYLKIRDKVNYHDYPCVHLAYFSVDEEDRCIAVDDGLFLIIIDKSPRRGIVIEFCPWCGIKCAEFV